MTSTREAQRRFASRLPALEYMLRYYDRLRWYHRSLTAKEVLLKAHGWKSEEDLATAPLAERVRISARYRYHTAMDAVWEYHPTPFVIQLEFLERDSTVDYPQFRSVSRLRAFLADEIAFVKDAIAEPEDGP